MIAENYFNGLQWDFYCISKGAIHAYRSFVKPVDAIISYVSLPDLKNLLFQKIRERNFNDADETLLEIIKSLKEQCAVCEMEIPIGEPYHLGLYSDICSHKMIFKNEIDIGDVAEDYILQQIPKSDDIYDEEVTLEYNRYRRRKRIRKKKESKLKTPFFHMNQFHIFCENFHIFCEIFEWWNMKRKGNHIMLPEEI